MQNMSQVFFHCSNAKGAWIDRRGAAVYDLADACEEATVVMRSLISSPSLEDWRGWVLHVSDETGEEIFSLSFAAMLGKPH
jgi:hypothetical protein